MSHPDNPFDPSSDNPRDRNPDGDPTGGNDERGVQGESGEIPVQGDEGTADRLATKAFGNKDDDDDGDAPNVPFPG